MCIPGLAFQVGAVRLGCVRVDFRTPSRERIGPAKFGVEIAQVGRKFLERFIIHVKVLVVRFSALVDQLQPGAFGKRHRGVAVERAGFVELVREIRGGREQRRLERIDHAMAQAEEIAQGHDDAGKGRLIVGDLQQALAGIGRSASSRCA